MPILPKLFQKFEDEGTYGNNLSVHQLINGKRKCIHTLEYFLAIKMK